MAKRKTRRKRSKWKNRRRPPFLAVFFDETARFKPRHMRHLRYLMKLACLDNPLAAHWNWGG